MLLDNDKTGERMWKELHEALKDRVWKAFGILPEGYVLFRKAVESYDLGAIEGAVLLCRATIESAFLLFLSIRWHSENSFNLVFPTKLDGKLRQVEFNELRNAIEQRVDFSKEQMAAINRIREDGNFVAHFASRKIKQRLVRVENYEKWEANNKNATDLERIMAVSKLVKSERSWITAAGALRNLRDTASIMVTLGKAVGRQTASNTRQ